LRNEIERSDNYREEVYELVNSQFEDAKRIGEFKKILSNHYETSRGGITLIIDTPIFSEHTNMIIACFTHEKNSTKILN